MWVVLYMDIPRLFHEFIMIVIIEIIGVTSLLSLPVVLMLLVKHYISVCVCVFFLHLSLD